MPDREQMIEEAAKAIWMRRNEIDDAEWGEMAWSELTMPDDWNEEALEAADAARAALTVFGRSSAPTDQDEREALRDALVAGERKSRSTGGSASGLYSAQADAILAAGFRRTPAEHPTDQDEREREWRKAIADQVRRNCTPSSEAVKAGGDHLVYAVADWIENPPAWSQFEAPAEHPEPPSDAEKQRDGYLADLQHVQAERNVAEAKLARIVKFITGAGLTSAYGRLTPGEARELDQILNDKEAE